MTTVVWIGAAVTVLGFLGILWSAVLVFRARRAVQDDAALRARLRQIVPINIGALFLSFLGLMAVIVGVILT